MDWLFWFPRRQSLKQSFLLNEMALIWIWRVAFRNNTVPSLPKPNKAIINLLASLSRIQPCISFFLLTKSLSKYLNIYHCFTPKDTDMINAEYWLKRSLSEKAFKNLPLHLKSRALVTVPPIKNIYVVFSYLLWQVLGWKAVFSGLFIIELLSYKKNIKRDFSILAFFQERRSKFFFIGRKFLKKWFEMKALKLLSEMDHKK